jgi:translocation and assembly module TamA
MRVHRRVATALLPLLLTACAADGLQAFSPPAQQPADDAAEGLETVAYEVSLQGVSNGLEDTIKQASRLFTFHDRPPGSLDALRRRIARDRTVIDDALRAEGYYAGAISIDINEAAKPVAIVITVDPGPLFYLTAFAVHTQRPDPRQVPIDFPLNELGIVIGQPARARDILGAEEKLITALARRSYPLAKLVEDKVVVDHATNSVAVDLAVDTGPKARFGPVTINGLSDVSAEYVRNRLAWAEGQPFDLRALEDAREKLIKSNLFSSIKLTPGQSLDEHGELPVVVELQERDHRTIGGTLSWSTNEGPGIEAYWEHRNLFSDGEKLRARGFYNDLGYGLETTFRKPDLFGIDWDLISTISLTQETTPAYDASDGLASIGADLQLTRHWKVTTSIAAEYLREETAGTLSHYTLASLPTKAVHDTRDDRLDPTDGGLFTIQFEPYRDFTGDAGSFLRLLVSDRIYHQVSTEPRIVLAGWADVGGIAGPDLFDLPAEKRFYAGGGGSVRGFGFQMAGPVDSAGNPTGGRSLLAFGGEARISVTEDIGIVPFIEAGTVYPSMVPDFSERLMIGAGIGLRYHTPIGPIRADVAFPLNARPGIDDSFQIYLSLGQAF